MSRELASALLCGHVPHAEAAAAQDELGAICRAAAQEWSRAGAVKLCPFCLSYAAYTQRVVMQYSTQATIAVQGTAVHA